MRTCRLAALAAIAFSLFLSGCAVVRRPAERAAAPGSDRAARMLVEELRRRQPAPYGLPDDSPYNYWWAQQVMAFLAAERCGYMDRAEALARIRPILEVAERCERHHGFWFDAYDAHTGKKRTDKIYFQGWWLYSLAVLKNAYPELAPACERMLADMDYEGSELFNPETRQLAADYFTDEKRISFWVDLYWQPTAEFRTPYVAYTYITGDITPWTRWATPRTIDIEGHPVLGVWHSMVFCTMYVHCMFPDVGYLERSWTELIAGLNAYRERHGMIFYPTHTEPLEKGLFDGKDKWPNTEHGIAKPWLTWLGDPDAPVIEKAWMPGDGVSLYYDNMRFFWSYGTTTAACDYAVGGDATLLLPFEAMINTNTPPPNPARLTSVQLIAAREPGATGLAAPLEIRLNGEPIASIAASELFDEPRVIRRKLDVVLRQRHNVLELSGGPCRLYRFESDFWKANLRRGSGVEPVRPPAVEITINGQHEGAENAYAFLARCVAVHGYYVWHEMLKDPVFLDRTVVWVGDYYDRARLGRVVHNVSDSPVTVRYERPAEWTRDEAIRVTDITDGRTNDVACAVGPAEVQWTAEARRTYRVAIRP